MAEASRVSLMLDEPICALADIDSAATNPGIGYCKLKRFGSLDRLIEGLERVRARGMKPVRGDWLGGEILGRLEACAAIGHIDNACGFNGFLKPRDRLLAEPLAFRNGAVEPPAGYRAGLDGAALERFTVQSRRFG